MSSPDQQASDGSPEPAPQQGAAPHRRFGGASLAAAAIGVVVLALVGGLLAQAGVFNVKGTAGSSTPWKTFRDGDGLYTLQMPFDWQIQTYTDTAGIGLAHQGIIPQVIEVVTLGPDPSLGVGALNVTIMATPIASGALAHSFYCKDVQGLPSSQKFDGISATEMGPATWFFTSADATFQIDATIPGVLIPPHTSPVELTPVPTATPLPAAQVATDQVDVNEVLTSLTLTNPKPLAC